MNEDDEDYTIFVTEKGAALAEVAIRLYALGFSADEIYDTIGLPDISDLDITKEQGLGVFMTVVRQSGALDG